MSLCDNQENFEHFQYFNFETDFLEKENFFKKLEYRFLVECSKIEKASFRHKTVMSEANVNGNYKMGLSQRAEFWQ